VPAVAQCGTLRHALEMLVHPTLRVEATAMMSEQIGGPYRSARWFSRIRGWPPQEESRAADPHSGNFNQRRRLLQRAAVGGLRFARRP